MNIISWFLSKSVLAEIHIVAILCAITVIILADHEAFAWVRGKKQMLSKKYMLILHVCTWAALIVLVITGTLLTWPQYHYLFGKPLFIMKLIMVGVLLTNAVIIGNGMDAAVTSPYAGLGWKDRLPLLTSGAISTVSWSTIIILGLYLFY